MSNVIDNGSAIAIFGNVDHLHPNEIIVRLSLDEDVTISTQPNMDGAWSLTVNSSAEQFYLNITANHDLEKTTSNTTFIEINRTASAEENGDTGQSQNFSILPHITVRRTPSFLANLLCGFNVARDDGMPVVFSTQLQADSVVPNPSWLYAPTRVRDGMRKRVNPTKPMI